jgi:RNA polymerase sigma factor (sigma-70 family)
MEWSDEELMQRLMQDDLSAFDALYTRHQARLHSFFKKRQTHKAQDLCQESFLRLLERRDQWKGQPFLPWFFVMARNLMLDELRRDQKRLIDFQRNEQLDVSDWLEGLSESDKNLIHERYFGGKSFEELSLEYSTSEVGLRQKMSRLLRAMRGSP